MILRRITIGIVILAVACTAGAFLFQRQLGDALFDRAVQQRVGRDNLASLQDGLHVGLCGTGSPLPSPDRAGPCNFIIAGKQLYIVDIGEGGARNMTLMGISPGGASAVFLTHFHSDHIDGMGPLALFHWTQETAIAPLPVYGPPGVETVVAGFNQAYTLDAGYRTAHHGPRIVPPGGNGVTAMPFIMDGGPTVVLEKDGLTVTAFKVDHDPVSPAVGYRFDYKGRSIVISGDTVRSTSLEQAAQGADVLVHEALQPRMVGRITAALGKAGQANNARITRDILDYHTTPEQAAASAQKAGVRQLVLSHLVPAIPGSLFYPAFLGEAPDKFDGAITVGEDGMLFSLPAGTTTIKERSLM